MRSLGLLLPVWLLCGCLVTDPIEFEDENFPPSLLSHPSGTPIGHVVTIAVDDVERTETTFRVLVRDRNHGQLLIGRYRLLTLTDGNLDPMDGDATDVRIPEGSEEIEMEFAISHSALQGGPGQCVRLDLFVSSGFVDRVGQPFEPFLEGDLAKASWWIWQVSDEIPSIDPSTCPVQSGSDDTPALQQSQQP